MNLRIDEDDYCYRRHHSLYHRYHPHCHDESKSDAFVVDGKYSCDCLDYLMCGIPYDIDCRRHYLTVVDAVVPYGVLMLILCLKAFRKRHNDDMHSMATVVVNDYHRLTLKLDSMKVSQRMNSCY